LLVKEILVGRDAIVIRHSIPLKPKRNGNGPSPQPAMAPPTGGSTNAACYLLGSGSNYAPLRRSLRACLLGSILRLSGGL
jgi:hypothetical protein